MRGLPGRFSDWVLSHPIVWAVGAGVGLMILGAALDVPPIVVVVAGAAVGALNVRHARRRGVCRRPTPSVG